jgi:hypothetical protein
VSYGEKERLGKIKVLKLLSYWGASVHTNKVVFLSGKIIIVPLFTLVSICPVIFTPTTLGTFGNE